MANTVKKKLRKFINAVKKGVLPELFASIDVIIKSYDPNLHSVIYKENANFEKHPLTRELRGLFFKYDEKSGNVEIIAHPFSKFFNLNEHKELFPEEFEGKMEKFEGKKKIFAFPKLDGAIIKLYFNEKWSFGSNNVPGQIPEAMKKYLEEINIDYTQLDKTKTYIFEFTTPLSHVTYYDKSELTLIGIKSIKTGLEDDITKLGSEHLGFKVVEFHEYKSIDEIQEFVDSKKEPNHPAYEGVIIYDHNNGDPDRFKLKSKEWMQGKIHSDDILFAGLVARFLDSDDKKVDDYKEVIRYIPSLRSRVDEVESKIRESIKELISEMNRVKKMDKRNRFNEIKKHPYHTVGMKFIDKLDKLDNVEVELYNELFKNSKIVKDIKNQLKPY